MTLSVTHTKVSAVTPIPAPTGIVTPTDWNAGHVLTAAGLSVLGVSTTGTGTVADIVGAANQVLRVASTGSTLAFGAINIASSSAVTGLLSPTNGGTGVNNGASTITLGASLTTTGAGAPTLAFPSSPFTYTFQASSDTIVGRATTDTLTNKTYDTAGTGNVLKINGTQVSAVTGSGSVVLATSPTIITPAITTSATLTNTLAANTSGDGLVLTNTTAATSGNQSFSPRLRLTGQGWQTGTSASQTVDWIVENKPIQGASNPATTLVFSNQVNSGGYVPTMQLYSVVTGTNPVASIFGAAASGLVLDGGGSAGAGLAVAGTSSDSQFWLARYSNNANPPRIDFIKSRGATIGANVVTSSGDQLGTFTWFGNTGSATSNVSALIRAEQVAGSIAGGAVPAWLVFSTAAPAGVTTTDNMWLQASGGLSIGASTDPAAGGLLVNGQGYWPNMATTASAANVFIDTATTPAGQLKRSTWRSA